MKRKACRIIPLLVCAFLYTSHTSAAPPEPREIQLEKALLQQLHPVIVASIKDIYKVQYATFNCEGITAINERVTIKDRNKDAIRADAIHGAMYFEITVSLCRVGAHEDDVELYLKNDTPTGEFVLDGYRIVPREGGNANVR